MQAKDVTATGGRPQARCLALLLAGLGLGIGGVLLPAAGALAQGSAAAEGRQVETDYGTFPAITPLPPPPEPADNPTTPEKVELGRKLFFDGRLSGNGSTGCVACHSPGAGWGFPTAISRGYPGTQHWRNSQTILNSAYYDKPFWDGSVLSLEQQAAAAAKGAVGGNGDPAMMEMRLRFVEEYVDAFEDVFGTPWPRVNDAWRAIAAFERTLVSDPEDVPFDRYTQGDEDAISESAKRGHALFTGQARCIACHNGALGSDQRFHRLGVPESPFFDNSALHQVTERWENYQKGVTRELYEQVRGDLGLYYVTKDPEHKRRFRTPSVRELKYTGPYMHNGVFSTLEEVVAFYNRGGGEIADKSPLMQPLGLTAQEQADLVAFLESLSSDEPPAADASAELPDYDPLFVEE